MKKLAASILKYRVIVILVTVLVSAILGYQLKNLRVNSDFIKSLPDSDPIAVQYKALGKKYKGTDMGMLVVEAPTIYDAVVLEHIRQVVDTLRVIRGIETVTGLTNIIDIKSDSSGIEIGTLTNEYDLPQTPEQLARLRERVQAKDMYKGSVVSEDGTATLIAFTLQTDVNQQEISGEVKKKIEALNLPETIHYGGMPMMLNDISDLIISDLRRLIPIIIGVLVVILALCFGSGRGVVLPLLTVGIASVWTTGIMALSGYDITLISGNIPVVLFAVGSAYVIHVVNHVKQFSDTDYKKALWLSLAYIVIPVFLSAVTTVFGFLSFIFGAYLTMIKEFGAFAALGTFLALLLSVTFVPAVQSLFKPEKQVDANEGKSFINNYMIRPLHALLHKHPAYIFSFWIAVIVAGVVMALSVERSTNIASYFKKGNPARVSEELLQKKFGGSLPVYVLFKGDMQSPDVLKTMIELEQFMEENPYISSTNSVADLIQELNDAMGEGLKIPDEKAKIEQLWFLLDGQDIMPQLVDDLKQEGLVQSRFASAKTKDIVPFIESMNQWIMQHQKPDCRIELNGMPSVYVQIDQSLLRSQVTSLAIAIVFVFLLIALIIKSIRLAVYAIIPILSTIVLLFGFMGITGIPLDIATVLVASVALGIGIDYSIHMINAFNHYKCTTDSFELAVEKAMTMSGNAIIINVFTVTGGFLVLLFSNLVPMQSFGLLVALSMIFSGLGALTLLPVILILVSRKKPMVAQVAGHQ